MMRRQLSAKRQRCRQLLQPGIVRQAEPQPIIGPIKSAAPDMLPRQRLVNGASVATSDQPIERCAADQIESGGIEHHVKTGCLRSQPLARLISPGLIVQRLLADLKRWPGAGPWPDRLRDHLRKVGRSKREAEPQTGKAVELAERFEHDDRQLTAQLHSAAVRHNIAEGFVDDQPATAVTQLRSPIGELRGRNDTSVGIVRINNHGMARIGGKIVARLQNLVPGMTPGAGMFAVGRPEDRNRACGSQPWQPLDQCLCSWSRDAINAVWNAIGMTRGIHQRGFFGLAWQALPGHRRDLANRPWPGIDARRKVEPLAQLTAVARHCFCQIAAVFHSFFMPFRKRHDERLARGLIVFAATICLAASPASAEAVTRIASINVCTDQLLLALANPEQIVGLSPYSRDTARSWSAKEAQQFPILSGSAEDVLMLRPDIVVAGRFTKRATRELLKQQGQRVVEFDAARTLDDARNQIRKMGELIGRLDRADQEIARLDAAVARAKAAAARRPFRVLSLSRRGWISGNNSLMTSVLATVGLRNSAGEIGFKNGGFASLEAIIALRPDYVLVSESSSFAEDEGRAFLLHPALTRLYPPEKRITVAEQLTVCGGPSLADALDRLTAELARVVN